MFWGFFLLIGRWDMTITNGPPSLLIYKIIDFNKKKIDPLCWIVKSFNCFIIILIISIRITKAILKMHIIFQLHWQMIRFIIGLKVTLFVFKLMVGHQNCSMIAVELWFRVTISIPLLSGHFHDYQNVPTSFDRGMTKYWVFFSFPLICFISKHFSFGRCIIIFYTCAYIQIHHCTFS